MAPVERRNRKACDERMALIRGGENIYCIEVGDVLYAHPAVMDAAVIGRPHPILGEEPVAVV
jgi:long-chain acyl-CoA synthetase